MPNFFSIVPPFFKKFRPNYFVPLFLILLIALLLRMPRMSESLWLDEILSTRWYMPDVFCAFVITLLREHMPFFYVLMFSWINLFGDSEWSVRMPSLIAGLYSILLTYWIAVRLLGKKQALLPTFLLALSCVHIWYSTESRPYAIPSMLLLATLLAYWNLRERTRLSGWDFIYFITSFAMIFTHLYMSLFIIAFLLMGLVERPSVRPRVIVINILILLVYFLFLYFKSDFSPIPTSHWYLRSFSLIELWMLFFNWYLTGNSIWSTHAGLGRLSLFLQNPLMIITNVVICAVFLKGLYFLWIGNKDRKVSYGREVVILLFVVPACLLILNMAGFKKIYIERSCYFALPFFFIVLAAGVLAFKNKLLKIIFIWILITISLASVAFFFKKIDQLTVHGYKSDWRSVANFLSDEIKTRDDHFIIYAKSPCAEALGYYYPSFDFNPRRILHVRVDRIQFKISVERIAQFLEKNLGKHNQAVVSIEKHLQNDEWNNIPSSRIPRVEFCEIAPDPEVLRKLGVNRFYFVDDLQWSNGTDELVVEAKEKAEYHFSRVLEFRGVKVYEFNLKNATS